jgi:hypothetical protein
MADKKKRARDEKVSVITKDQISAGGVAFRQTGSEVQTVS